MTRTDRTTRGAGSPDTDFDDRYERLDDDSDETDAWLVEASRRLEEPDRDIARLISSITGKLGRVRRNGRILDTDDETIRVNDRVVKQLLATRIRHTLGRLVVLVELDSPDSRDTGESPHAQGSSENAVSRVRIGLIARYHDDLVADSDRVREVADDVLASTLGPSASATARQHIDIRWQDLYTRNWID
ncbi:hypothetical protein [Gordonia sputi]